MSRAGAVAYIAEGDVEVMEQKTQGAVDTCNQPFRCTFLRTISWCNLQQTGLEDARTCRTSAISSMSLFILTPLIEFKMST